MVASMAGLHCTGLPCHQADMMFRYNHRAPYSPTHDEFISQHMATKSGQARSLRAQAGFTLIELIVVIVILGILAATALPKFADLSGDARKAAVHSAGSALTAVSAMAHGKSLITGSWRTPVDIEGISVAMVIGYPSSAATTAAAAGLTTDEWTIRVNGRDLIVSPLGAASAARCNATYSEATATGSVVTTAKVVVVDSGC